MNEPIYLSLIQNAALLLMLVLLYDLLMTRGQISDARAWQVLSGLTLGGIGIIIMMTPWVMAPGIIYDTRSVLLGISGLFFGPLPTVIAMTLTSAFRLYLGGQAVWSGVMTILATGTLGILWRLQLRKPLEALSVWQLYLFGLVIHAAMLFCQLIIPQNTVWKVLSVISLPVMLIYPIATLGLGLLLIDRLRRERLSEERSRSESRLNSLVEIFQHPIQSAQEFLDFSLEQAISLTGSQIGFIDIYSEDREEFRLNTFSKGVMAECAVLSSKTCYPLKKTGAWGEAVHQQKPILINNYAAENPLKKGIPEGHVRLKRVLIIPVFHQGQIAAVVGVANKESDYDESDVVQLTLLMDGVWKAVLREQAEEGLRQSEERYAAIASNLPNALIHIFDKEFRYVYNTGLGLTSAGLSNEMLVGKSIFEVLGFETGNFVAGFYQKVLAGEVVFFEGEFAGEYYSIQAAPLRDKQGEITQILALSLDITPRKKAEEALRSAKAELQDLLTKSEQARRALLSVLEDQKIGEAKLRELNAELEQRLLEISSLAVIDSAVLARLEPQKLYTLILQQVIAIQKVDATVLFLFEPQKQLVVSVASIGYQNDSKLKIIRQLGDGSTGHSAQERRIIHRDLTDPENFSGLKDVTKSENFQDYYAVPLLVEEKLVGVLEVLHRSRLNPDEHWLRSLKMLANQAAISINSIQLNNDIQISHTELLGVMEDLKTADSKLRALNAELESRVQVRTAELIAVNHEMEAFAYSISHDLRAPLRAMSGFSDALLTDYQNSLDEKGRHYLSRIQDASRKMGQLIEDLLSLSRVTRREMRVMAVNLSDLADQIVRDLMAQIPERAIEFEIAPNMHVQADAGLIKIALENLLANAVKFSDKSSIARIQVGTLEQSGQVTYFVRDNGVGFNMAYADKLFVPFQRLHSEQEFPGTGIGLVTVQRIIARHGGRVWCDAEVDKGAIFYFTLEANA